MTVYNLQEIANKTDVTQDKTWPTFPIRTPANDWAMDTRKEGKNLTRLGTQWQD